MRKTGWRWASATHASSGASGVASKNGRVIGTSVTDCFRTGALSSGPSSTMPNGLRLAPTAEGHLARGSGVAHPGHLAIGGDEPAMCAFLHQGHGRRVCVCRCVGLAPSTDRCVAVPDPPRRRVRTSALRRRRQRAEAIPRSHDAPPASEELRVSMGSVAGVCPSSPMYATSLQDAAGEGRQACAHSSCMIRDQHPLHDPVPRQRPHGRRRSAAPRSALS